MAGYIGTKAVNLSTTGADINGNANVDGTLDVAGATTVTGAFTSLGIDDNAAATAVTIDASGNVGIGTSVPSSDVDILGSSSRIRLDGSSASFQILSRNTADSATNALTFDADSYTFNRAGSAKAVIDSSGNVGIGTTSPNGKLAVLSDQTTVKFTNPHLALTVGTTTDNTGFTGISYASSTVANFGWTAGALRSTAGVSAFTFNTHATDAAGTERMRIDASGNLLVGKTTLSGADSGFILNPSTLSGGDNAYLFVTNTRTDSGGYVVGLNRQGSTGDVINFRQGDTTVGEIVVTGSATAYNTSSDYRLKENITPIQGAGDIVKAMRPCTYTFKADGDWADGFLAHELQELHPVAVSGSKDAMKDEEYEVTPAVLDDEGNVVTEAVVGTRSVPDYQGVDYSKLTPILTAALQEALNKIDALEARLTALEATP